MLSQIFTDLKKLKAKSALFITSIFIIVYFTLFTNLSFYLNFVLLKPYRLAVIDDFQKGIIKPNVEGALSLYQYEKTFPNLSSKNIQISIESSENNSIRVKFFSDQPLLSKNKSNLVYSTDTLFNKRIEYLITIDKYNHCKLEKHWYRTAYHPGLSDYKEVEEMIK